MSNETKLFTTKLLKLKEVLTHLRSFEQSQSADGSLKALDERLDKLKIEVENEGSLNAGGKFEWIDSLLIKCLQEGCWLLIENVNLCSPAVLDRLNALLEPNGVLTIGERGVDANGEMVNVIPHKNFRLFLTMDPKNGEISRAMRNRGVEIYILNDSESGCRNEYDIKALIEQNGVSSENLQEMLIQLHDYMSELILGEKPTISDILQTSFLIYQQLLRGISVSEAFTTSLIDVYVRSKSWNDFKISDPIPSIESHIKIILQAFIDKNNFENFKLDQRTLKSMDLQNNSNFELIRQQSLLIPQIQFINLSRNFTPYLFFGGYSVSSYNNARLKCKYLAKQLNTANNEICNELNDKLCTALNNFFQDKTNTINIHMPLDMRWLPDTYNECTNIYETNQMVLLLYVTAFKILYGTLKIYVPKTKDLLRLTVLEYSKAASENLISQFFIEHPLIKHFYKLITVFDEFLINLIQKEKLQLSTEDVVQAFTLLNWRFVLQEIGSLPVYDKYKKDLNLNQVLSQVTVRYKWFFKHTVKYFMKLAKNEDITNQVTQVMNLINTDLQDKFSNFTKIARHFTKSMPRPLPPTDMKQISFAKALQYFEEQLCFTTRYNSEFRVRCNLLLHNSEIRTQLLEIKTEFLTDRKYAFKVLHKVDILVKNATKNEPNILEIQLLPIKDMFALYFISKLKNDIVFSNESTLNENSILRKTLSVPSELVAVANAYCKTKDEKLLCELILLIAEYSKASIGLSPSRCLNWENMDDDNFNMQQLSLHVPSITYLITNLCVCVNNNQELVSLANLGKYKEKCEQLKYLNELLWLNISSISSTSFDIIKNDSSYISRSFQKFVLLLEKSLIGYNTTGSTIDIANNCIKEINYIYIINIESKELIKNKKKIINIIQQCCNHIENLKTADNTHLIIHTANIYCLLNYLKAILNIQLPVIDPLEKIALKKEYCEQEKIICTDMKEAFVMQNEIYSGSSKTLHPFCAILAEKIKMYEEREINLSKHIAVRPDYITYEDLVKDTTHNLNTLLCDEFFTNMFEKLNSCINNVREATHKKLIINLNDSYDVLNQSLSWLNSQGNSFIKLEKYRLGYCDIIEPILSSVTELSYGVKLLHSVLEKLLLKYEHFHEDLDKFITNLVQFPTLSASQKSITNLVEICSHDKNTDFISNIIGDNEIPNIIKQENLSMLKCGIQELYNLFVISSPNNLEASNNMLIYLENLINLFVTAWCKQEAEREKKEEEEKSIYKTKTKCESLTEEEEMFRDMRKLFPCYHEQDFSDIQPATLDDSIPEISVPSGSDYIGVITNNDVNFISNIHAELLQTYSRTEWLNPQKKNLEPEFVQPLLQRFKLYNLLQPKIINGLDYKLDKNLICSLNLLVCITKYLGEGNDVLTKNKSNFRRFKEKNYDFYKDSKVEEVKLCFPILEALHKRVLELLRDWSEHPTLKTIHIVLERIYSFSITSPISRFLTGLEILLSKCHEWEENAHSGVSLQEYTQNITLQIISWRKLELAGWKDCLNNTTERINRSASKWWFHIYSTVQQFIVIDNADEENFISAEKFVKVLLQFIEKSTLAEYRTRLELLFVFHCHILNVPKTKKSEMAACILWNLYNFYKQFVNNIDVKIKNLRTPIEKKLKDFVKIARWNDINYWSVKETVEKTHRTLIKYIKEFENVLKGNISDCLVNVNADVSDSEQVGIWDRQLRHSPSQYHYTLDSSTYVASAKFKKLLNENSPPKAATNSKNLIHNSEKYFNKSRNFCKDTISSTSYPNLIQHLDSFVTEIIETSNYLRNLEVNSDLPKPKQKSQAKNILQQKRKALADLFKALAKCGLSYRTGMIEAKLRENTTPEFFLKPLDLEASFSQLKNKGSCDRQLLNVWDGCETYFLRTIARLAALNSALRQPSVDLGLQNIERCKGFSMHLMILAEQQKVKLIESSRNLYYLRHYVSQLSDIHEEAYIMDTNTIKFINDLLINIIVVMEQYKIILLSCPEQSSFSSDLIEISLLDMKNQNLIKYKDDLQWNSSFVLIKNIIVTTNKFKTTLDKMENKLQSAEINVETPNYIFVQSTDTISTELHLLQEKIASLRNMFGDNVISNSLNWLLNELKTAETKLGINQNNQSSISVDKFKTDVEKLIENILLPIQNIYKKYNIEETKQAKETENAEENQESEQFKDNHLKLSIVENLFEDISTLEMKTVFRKVKKLTTNLYKMNAENSKKCRSLISQCIPLLEQLLLLYQYFITQQVSAYRVTCKLSSVLLNIFIELASKGFCIPEEFSEELNAEGQSKDAGGMGLGDGEGEKDVSDRIESEDQLDDAQPAGQERKNEDKDCKEEEKGVEMSEDFEGKLQDVEQPNEDESQSDANSDAEKQMGDTQPGCDQLDQQIWGSDDEQDDDNEEEDGQNDKEERGEGGEVENKQMAAKENNTAPNEEDEKENDNNEKKQKQEDINEMNEPEYDDEQIDPYHGNQPELPEPEPMDLPDDLQLDDGEEKEEQGETNPFDIDTMKDQIPPDDETKEDINGKDEPTESEEKQNDVDSSDEDEDNANPAEDMETDDKQDRPKEENEEQNDMGDFAGKQENEENPEPENNNASALDNQQSSEDQIQPMEVENTETSDNVQTNPNQASAQNSEQISQEESHDKDGVGQSQMEESETGHRGEVNVSKDSLNTQRERENEAEKRQKPGESDCKRSLGETTEPVKKKMKTINIQDKNIEEEDVAEEQVEEGNEAEIYQHIKEAKESDTQVLDAATREQAETQKIENKEDDTPEETTDEPIEMATDEPEPELIDTKEQKPEPTDSKSKKKQDGKRGDIVEEIKDMEIEGDVVETMTVSRGDESTYHTQYDILSKAQAERLSSNEIQGLRLEIETQLGKWNEPPPNAEAEQTWEKFSAITSSLSRDLSEQLRLVLEPTQASRLRGDFRTGRRINMRKVIPYIASQFRKDKIWLRRTKPSKREYQIVLAIDDSSSMDDNHSKELAFESVALISKALTLLESGQLSVLSFGENTEILHKLTDTFTEKSGVKLLQNFQFQQKKTCVANLVDFVTNMFSTTYTNAWNAKLLIIVSDGRGIFSEGENIVRQAIRRAKFADIFMVFVIIDNPENKNSILDIRMPVFNEGKLLGIKSYIDSFPFPFYIILRNINSLPSVLSDALRQWFELVTNVDK